MTGGRVRATACGRHQGGEGNPASDGAGGWNAEREAWLPDATTSSIMVSLRPATAICWQIEADVS